MLYSESVITRMVSLVVLVACGGSQPPARTPSVSDRGDEHPLDVQRLVARMDAVPSPIGETWTRDTRALLLDAFDRDRSGAIDADAEVSTIPCEVYVSLHKSMFRGQALGLMLSFSLAKGLPWGGHTLGFAETTRDALLGRNSSCLADAKDLPSREIDPETGAPIQ